MKNQFLTFNQLMDKKLSIVPVCVCVCSSILLAIFSDLCILQLGDIVALLSVKQELLKEALAIIT